MYKRIAVTTDFSTHSHYALERALQFAQANHAELFCLHVISGHGPADAHEPELIERAEQAYVETRQSLSDYHVPVQFVLLQGRPPEQITQYLTDHKIDLVFMGTHGTYYVHDFLLGTTSEAVIKLAQIPVQLVKKKPAHFYHRILVTTDFSDNSKQVIERAYQAYPQAEFLLLHVADLWYETNSNDEMHQSLHQKLINFLDECDVDESHFSVKFIGGYPADDISKFAEQWQAQLVVLGTSSRSLLHYLLIGRVSERLLRINMTDMLVIPPVTKK